MSKTAFPLSAQMDTPLAVNPLVVQARLFVLSYRIGLRCQAELLGFLQHRTKLFDTCLRDLVESIELNDSFDVLTDYFQSAFADYPRAFAKMAAVTSSMEAEGARLARKLADDVADDIGAKTVS
ncbi:hypothetical protein FHT82_001013 [Rhizobium sp. BK275]|uniref:hypothetical protein n=1 Tax=Rhizobium sp. BK275 TaxID=2587077 RepID=UPI00160CF947|nr:hypothetical protein [Rhizobium sp. BK275]MBB3388293.1 hypothetical protein [Rhizobium sp. BK275]